MMQNRSQRLKILLLLGCGLFISVFNPVYAQVQSSPQDQSHRVDEQDMLELSEEEKEQMDDGVDAVPIEQIRNFVETFQIVKNDYVDQVSDEELFEQAIQGLLEGLDPYSRYLNTDQYQKLLEFTEGEIAEPQFKLSYDPEIQNWILQGISNNSEHYRHGLRNNFIVDRINRVNIQHLDERTVNNLLTGSLGSILTLRVKIDDKLQLVDVIRDKKISYDVEPFLTDDKVLTLKIKAFQSNTIAEVQNIIRTYQQRTMIRGVLIDIRDNPGGLLSAAVDLADLFLEQGLIVSTKGRSEPSQRFQAFPSQFPITYQIIILQNRYSASAAEVFAAALQENRRALVVGERSYGKGAVQKLFPLRQGALQLTVSHYYTPKGNLIDGKGIEPDRKINMNQVQNDRLIINQAIQYFE